MSLLLHSSQLLDYEAYDYSKDEEKRRKNMGFAVEKVGRSGDRFYGSRWRGCANLVPTNLPSIPTSYIAPKAFERTRKPTDTARSIMDSKSDRLGTIDGLRLSLNNIPNVKSFVHEKIGPGSYKDGEARAAKEGRGRILLNKAYQGSSFRGTGRKDREGDKWDVFRDANIRRKEAMENIRKVEKASAEPEDKFSMYKNIKPTASVNFLKRIEVDDVFHAHLKRIQKKGETDDDVRVTQAVWKSFRARENHEETRRRVESSELILENPFNNNG